MYRGRENPRARWGIWILPWLLSLDNITHGAVDGVSNGASVGLSAVGAGVLHVVG